MQTNRGHLQARGRGEPRGPPARTNCAESCPGDTQSIPDFRDSKSRVEIKPFCSKPARISHSHTG